ncbi:MAG: flagellar protein FlaG [Gammaproteobacteria bacterium]|nr:flagellar protein FlaG [Gammaproteobacteria bacterium]
MTDKEPLSRVTEFRPSARYARISNVAPTQGGPAPMPSIQQSKESGPTAYDPQALQTALDKMTAHVQNLQRALQFSVDEESGETVVKVVDTETKEVIRQIPSEELLAIANRLRSTAGVLVADSV